MLRGVGCTWSAADRKRGYVQEPSEGEEAVKAKLAALSDTLQTRFRNLEDD
jgi:hypothetical protein